ncbi:C45 family autoproteolytic acyltransferase/hydolase [Solicola gregarius]|uniref:C45 family peptidase n=1 Tax=Solicola gregarius TaxID=2908642 RepID=A0AA46TK42_9ACTN|nr:C45 family peptidase [Solicola gregarius]UYM06588.1 C45 family peptidase [Solicola gregarius]
MTIQRFVTAERDPRTRGEEIARLGAEHVRANLDGYVRLFRAVGVEDVRLREFGTQAADALAAWRPDLHAEMCGVAAGTGLTEWELGLLNARTEVLAAVGAVGEGECSTSVYLPDDGAPRGVQTWDWHDELDADRLLARYVSDRGLEVRYFTEFGMLGKIGINDAGLGLHFNILNHSSDSDPIGVPVHAVARSILDSATTIAEAVEIADSASVSASTVLTVLTYDGDRGDAACIELCPAGHAVVGPEDGLLVHTNHFVDPELARGELAPATASTYRRYKHVRSLREQVADPDPRRRAEALAVHEVDGAPVCCHPDPEMTFDQRWESLLTTALDLEHNRMWFHDGRPCGVRPETWHAF